MSSGSEVLEIVYEGVSCRSLRTWLQREDLEMVDTKLCANDYSPSLIPFCIIARREYSCCSPSSGEE